MSTKKKDKNRKKKKLRKKNKREAKKSRKAKDQAKVSTKHLPELETVSVSDGKIQMAKQYTEIIIEGEAIDTAYDEYLLERSRTQWQFGDWESLVKLDKNLLEHHPDRAKLALLAAAGLLQLGSNSDAKAMIKLSLTWGSSKKLVSQVLISGVQNSIGRTAALAGDGQRALKCFEDAIQIGTPGSDGRLLTQARARHQLEQLNLVISPDKKINVIRRTSSFTNDEGTSTDVKPAKQKSDTPNKTRQNRATYLNRNGEILYKENNYKLAIEYFERALELTPSSAWITQNLAEAIARLDFNKGDEWECDALVKDIAETGKWDVVVRRYRKALQLDPAIVYSHQQAQTFKIAPLAEDTVKSPVFIVGCGHSGTSLMTAILGNHPSFYVIPKESGLFLQTDGAINKAMAEWDKSTGTEDKIRWLEKTPPHIFQIHRFLAFRPHCRFIIMLRDGRDVVCSLKFRKGYEGITDRLDRWVYDNMAALPYWNHPQVQFVKYEDLVQDSEGTLLKICNFLGEDYRPEMLEYHKTEHHWYSDKIIKPEQIKTHQDHMNNRNWQINQPIFDGRGRWQKELTEEEKKLFKESQAQEYLQRFGYVKNPDW